MNSVVVELQITYKRGITSTLFLSDLGLKQCNSGVKRVGVLTEGLDTSKEKQVRPGSKLGTCQYHETSAVKRRVLVCCRKFKKSFISDLQKYTINSRRGST